MENQIEIQSQTQRIVVAVGTGDVTALLEFAAREAVAGGSALHLVHVVRMPPNLPESYAVAYEAAKDYGARVLARAVAAATARVDGAVAVTSELVTHGSPVGVLTERSSNARMVVLQHRQLTGARRMTSASTTNGVAARAHAPVVAVPESWAGPSEDLGPVVVAVKEPGRSREILRAAFEVAARRGTGVRVIHAWWLANGYDGVVVDDAMRREEKDRFVAEATPELEALRADYPGVPTSIVVIHAPAALALTDAAESAGLLVLGRRRIALAIGSHLGSVARTVIRQSPVPVMVVEPAGTPADKQRGR